ncbi:hypothetical protein HanIR_Chr09g0395911 [Helianthus annuus]|nr:hypothetical protein HanIR_Chr09g0395911 [Helianthus annuus]
MSNKNKSPATSGSSLSSDINDYSNLANYAPMAEGQRTVSPYLGQTTYAATRDMSEDWYGKGYDSSTQQRPRLSGVSARDRKKKGKSDGTETVNPEAHYVEKDGPKNCICVIL